MYLTLLRRIAHALVAGATIFTTMHAHAGNFVLAYTDGQVADSLTSVQSYYGSISAIGLGSTYSIQSSGAVVADGMTNTTTQIIGFAKSKNISLYPTVSDYSNAYGGFDPSISHSIISSSSRRALLVANLVKLAASNGFAGIDLDVEAVQPADKANYSALVSALATALHGQGMRLIVSIPAKLGDTSPDYLNGYDYASIGAAVDYLQVMTYDQVGPGWSTGGFNRTVWPGPESGLDWQRAVLAYTTSRVPASKVLSGLPTYGYDYSTGNPVHWKDYSSTIGQHSNVSYLRDAPSATPYASWGSVSDQPDGVAWSNATKQPVLWYDDGQSIQAKAGFAASFGLGGLSVWAMGYENADFWSAVNAGLNGGAAPSTLTIAASAGVGGQISPAGAITVVQGAAQSFAITPSSGYALQSVIVDGNNVGVLPAYTFYNVVAGHTISASFAATGTGDAYIERSGTGYTWSRNNSATSNGNRVTRPAINDGNLSVVVNLNASGENGAVRWESAGVIWTAPKTISSVEFVNGSIDGYGNGYFQSGVRLQFSSDGVSWVDSNWTMTPAYPNSAAAAGVRYQFSGTAREGVRGVRVTGATGSDAWSAIVNEVQAMGR